MYRGPAHAGRSHNGLVRGRKPKAGAVAKDSQRAPDLLNRDFTAARPNAVWVTDFTYVRTWAAFAYLAFAIVIAASGFRVPGVAVLAVLAVGAGQVALNQVRTISAPAGVNAARASIQKAEAKELRARSREEERTAVASRVPEHNERPARRIG